MWFVISFSGGFLVGAFILGYIVMKGDEYMAMRQERLFAALSVWRNFSFDDRKTQEPTHAQLEEHALALRSAWDEYCGKAAMWTGKNAV